MTLYDILSTISYMDKVSIHANSGYVLFDGVKDDLENPINKVVISSHLNTKVNRVRACNNTIIILL